MPVATAGSTPSVYPVSSIQGMGMSCTGAENSNPVTTGSSTYTPPNASPMTPPMENTRHFQLFSRSSVDSARAMVPRAPTGAMGKGSFSTSEVMRYSVYPRPKWSTRWMNWVPNSSRMGMSQSR